MTDPQAGADAERAGNVRVARNAFFLVVGQGATTALGIVYSGSLGRFLGANEFGLFFLLSSFAAFAYVLVDWGQQLYVIREVARSPQRSGDLLGTGIISRGSRDPARLVPTGLAAWALGYGRARRMVDRGLHRRQPAILARDNSTESSSAVGTAWGWTQQSRSSTSRSHSCWRWPLCTWA